MSNCVHKQSTYKLTALPKCKRCNTEMSLVLAHYENKKDLVWEWECSKCGKIVKRDFLKEEKLSDENIKLSEWCNNEQKNNTSFRRNNRPNK